MKKYGVTFRQGVLNYRKVCLYCRNTATQEAVYHRDGGGFTIRCCNKESCMKLAASFGLDKIRKEKLSNALDLLETEKERRWEGIKIFRDNSIKIKNSSKYHHYIQCHKSMCYAIRVLEHAIKHTGWKKTDSSIV